MLAVSVLLNLFAWIAVGYLFGSYFGRSNKLAKLSIVVSMIGAIAGGFFTILAYGLPETFVWANNMLFAMIGSLGMVYATLPEKARSVRLEQFFAHLKKFNKRYIDFAGIRR